MVTWRSSLNTRFQGIIFFMERWIRKKCSHRINEVGDEVRVKKRDEHGVKWKRKSRDNPLRWRGDSREKTLEVKFTEWQDQTKVTLVVTGIITSTRQR